MDGLGAGRSSKTREGSGEIRQVTGKRGQCWGSGSRWGEAGSLAGRPEAGPADLPRAGREERATAHSLTPSGRRVPPFPSRKQFGEE